MSRGDEKKKRKIVPRKDENWIFFLKNFETRPTEKNGHTPLPDLTILMEESHAIADLCFSSSRALSARRAEHFHHNKCEKIHFSFLNEKKKGKKKMKSENCSSPRNLASVCTIHENLKTFSRKKEMKRQ